ncbi:MAG: Lysine-tRNA ligase [Parcubacteria group bacterium GW2011_GWD2_38_12]|nr:MAG: Lysine-tRNA ligase [Parcubacteria group bacterium GW2011_GWC2_36_17]KKQ39414.1 MAG: Lysine-tRNA ligase [Candidatus Moranbacteria bacterium GW2011_GWF2_37_7]KKQ43911.1 MAG: Lysine-tRNA ligase [Parcubacteria group bacterium GW2011_GWE2_37_8]KKQ52841.1 MAG: Lysine-tRNA ligase [Parcubacteria group bacterium GW2011_GWD2_38_12]KKQ59044.1 MAG: Lysine-tRNA ligase [Parcubacteria group bacterium GW2011_GWC1_38_17]KKQ59659.1 MAG: Lysine-tRNA ligase [Parcubacteria group bacterium GW2011_GWD1_38_16
MFHISCSTKLASIEEIRDNRIKKLEELRKFDINPYPAKSGRNFSIADILTDFDNLAQDKKEVILAGRITSLRGQGALIFVDLKDGSGSIQLFFKKDNFSDSDFEKLQNLFDIGDIVESGGILFVTKRGEKTLEVKNFRILTKSLRPIPTEFYGLSDIEERYRRRYLDLLLNDDVREKFIKRSKIINVLREFYNTKGYLEVETPILQTIPGGATAKPFKTHLNALDLDLYLRIAPELYLKRLLVGGFEKVYEIGRCFRNEGMDATHNPDFTMLESYSAYENYKDLMIMVERLMEFLIAKIYPDAENYRIEYKEQKIIFKAPYMIIEFTELLKEHFKIDYDEMSEDELFKFAEKEIKNRKSDLKLKQGMHKGKIADELYKEFIRSEIIQPIFMINHPLELSPLAKKTEENPLKVERFQLIVAGIELMNGYSELNDPIDQHKRFREQENIGKSGDEEVQRLDIDYIEALEYGMPPAAGLGIGVERLVMLLTDSQTLRESMLFPTMKPRGEGR